MGLWIWDYKMYSSFKLYRTSGLVLYAVPKNNSVFYPSIGTSLIVSDIFRMPKWISYAKFRSSWAQVGGATPGSICIAAFFYFVTSGHNGQKQLQGYTNYRVYLMLLLSPLTSTTFEIGTDLGF